MNRFICSFILLMIAAALFVLPVCGQEGEAAEDMPQEVISDGWTREGFFRDEEGNILSVFLSDTEGYEGWLVGSVINEESHGNVLQQIGYNLRGDLVPDYEEGEFIVTISEEGEDGLKLTADSGEVYHFLPVDPAEIYGEPSEHVFVDTEGMGTFIYAEGESTDWINGGAQYGFVSLSVGGPQTYTFKAVPYEGCNFIKWTKDGMDHSTDEQITVKTDESASFTAVFDYGITPDDEEIDYLVLVNKLNPVPEGWEAKLQTVHTTNSLGDDVETEKYAYESYLRLRDDLAAEGITVDLDSAYRSTAEQQAIMDHFTEIYGADYAAKTVAVPGYSEHQTGLALDLYLNIGGKDVYMNEDMVQYPEIWAKIHEKLADYGFILRYLKGKEHITGYNYEPWHIRYIADADIAHEIMDQGITLEGWLGAARETDPEIDYGTSAVYTQEELESAADRIKCEFASRAGFELHSLRYAGDEANNEENLNWLNSLKNCSVYSRVAEFLTDFHSPAEGEIAWEPDYEYKDYQWWLGETEEDGWEIVTMGY